jgi:hypothetical protein
MFWDLIKPVRNLAFDFNKPIYNNTRINNNGRLVSDLYLNPTAPLTPLYPNSPVGKNRSRQNLTCMVNIVSPTVTWNASESTKLAP